ncbi:hypothetical protein HOD20_01435 [archaeon]|jgi:endonuclease/exonuclease/phosphatase family metal-dependent hydrolase|nr:hypothetical protein [archaeon]MBT4351167.1 hypothetical protein [archaeon]MBT4648292.1 hypothetical protein [archaeon]MBT6821546.1 hypothetical protein [archaeon]MBT7391943.1 hypothetical protein [archaeon]
MKVISWNVSIDNKKQIKTIKKALDTDADIICLNEISKKNVEFLKTIDKYNFHYGISFRGKNEHKNIYMGILSKYPFLNSKFFSFETEFGTTMWNLFVNKHLGAHKVQEGQYVDIVINSKEIRIFNFHLPITCGPKKRIEQFKKIVNNINENMSNIFCGDFNNYGKWYLNIFTHPLFSQKINEVFTNEKKTFEKLFKQHELNNIFNGISTWPKLGFINIQIDHILTPHWVNVISKEVLKKTYGSDHRMLMTELDI